MLHITYVRDGEQNKTEHMEGNGGLLNLLASAHSCTPNMST
jgi:hypothetical protein